MRKEDWLEAMTSGTSDEKMDPVPLEAPDGTQVDPSRFFVQFRFPSGVEFDTLTALQTRNVLESEGEFDPDNIENSRVTEVEYTDTRRTPILFKAVEIGLIVDAALPKKLKDGTIGEYRWAKSRSDNTDFLRKTNPILLMSLVYMLFKNVLSKGYGEVVEEGEESADAQGVNTSASTGETEPEEV